MCTCIHMHVTVYTSYILSLIFMFFLYHNVLIEEHIYFSFLYTNINRNHIICNDRIICQRMTHMKSLPTL